MVLEKRRLEALKRLLERGESSDQILLVLNMSGYVFEKLPTLKEIDQMMKGDYIEKILNSYNTKRSLAGYVYLKDGIELIIKYPSYLRRVQYIYEKLSAVYGVAKESVSVDIAYALKKSDVKMSNKKFFKEVYKKVK
mgnify:FL=1